MVNMCIVQFVLIFSAVEMPAAIDKQNFIVSAFILIKYQYGCRNTSSEEEIGR